MRRFLKRLLFFLLVSAVVFPALDFLFSRRAQQSSRASIEGWNDLMYGRFDADLLVIGSSRAKNHVNPSILDSVLHTDSYNMGMSGTRIDLQLAQYDLYRLRHPRPGVIIHCLDVFSLIPIENVTGRSQYFPFFWDREFRRRVFPLVHFTLAERFIPLYRYYPGELPELLDRYPRSLQKGFSIIDGRWNSPRIDSVRFERDGRYRAMFERYVDQVSAEGTQLVFVLPPMYIEKARRIQALDEMLDYYKGIGEEYGIPLLDYYFSDISRDSTNFLDPNHLNRKGADAFTDTLAHDLLDLRAAGRLP